MKNKTIGSFDLMGTTLVIGDPCYSLDDEGAGLEILHNCAPGKWSSSIEEDKQGNPIKLTVTHVDFLNKDIDIDYSETMCLPVDSGQLGVFDKLKYGKKIADESSDTIDFYDMCCKHSLSPQGYGLIPSGIVSTTLYGDGWYDVDYAYNTKDKTILEISIDLSGSNIDD